MGAEYGDKGDVGGEDIGRFPKSCIGVPLGPALLESLLSRGISNSRSDVVDDRLGIDTVNRESIRSIFVMVTRCSLLFIVGGWLVFIISSNVSDKHIFK